MQPSDIPPDYRIIIVFRRNIILHAAYIIHKKYSGYFSSYFEHWILLSRNYNFKTHAFTSVNRKFLGFEIKPADYGIIFVLIPFTIRK